ncbi:MAG: transposase family protein [Opitutales bacterium]|nr:transposase family protein [Opitutales bacterium]
MLFRKGVVTLIIPMDNLQQEIERKKQELAELEKQAVEQRKAKLLGLHKEVGLNSIDELISELEAAAGRKSPSKGKGRGRITPELREKIGEALRGGASGSQVAREFGISTASVQNIKQDLGLVKKRS